MLQTYQGYFEKGRFVSSEIVAIPDKTQVLITFIEKEPMPPLKTKGQKQMEALDKFVAAINDIEDEPIDSEAFYELENSRANIGRDLNL